MKLNKKAILAKAYKKWGWKLNFIVVIEEMAELTKVLTKAMRNDFNYSEMSEEIADVELVIEGIRNYLGFSIDVREFKNKKLIRLKKRLR